ncbi:MAG: hypothetical protein R3F61_30075 [Myxococcota bacterium]
MSAPVLVPALQRHDWPNASHVVHQPLVKGDSAWMPILAFADDHPHTRTLRTEGDAEALRQASKAALGAMRYEIGVMGPDDGPGFAIAVLEGGEYASEQILNVAAMREVAQRLGCRDLVAAVPFRGALFAVDMGLPKPQMATFLQLMSSQYFHARSKPLSPLGLIVIDGVVCGEAAGLEESGRHLDGREEGYIDADVSIELSDRVLRVRAAGSDQRAVTDLVSSHVFSALSRLGVAGVQEVGLELTFEHLDADPVELEGFARTLKQGAAQMVDQGAQVARIVSIGLFGPQGPIRSATEGLPDAIVSAAGEAPTAVFILVAGADGRFEDDEVQAFLSGLPKLASPIVKAGLLANQEPVMDTLQRLLRDPMALTRSLVLTRTLASHGPDGVQTLQELMSLGVRVAAVSAGRPVQSLADLRPEERVGLDRVAGLLGITL